MMTNVPRRSEWSYIETLDGPLKPGVQIADSSSGNFSVISNSAGGTDAKSYVRQLQIVLEGLLKTNKVLHIENRQNRNK